MENELVPNNCPHCESEVKKIPAGISKKTRKPYNEFWACSNRDCDYTWNSPDKPKSQRKPEAPVSGETTRDQILMDEVKSINLRLDKIIAYLVEKLGKPE